MHAHLGFYCRIYGSFASWYYSNWANYNTIIIILSLLGMTITIIITIIIINVSSSIDFVWNNIFFLTEYWQEYCLSSDLRSSASLLLRVERSAPLNSAVTTKLRRDAKSRRNKSMYSVVAEKSCYNLDSSIPKHMCVIFINTHLENLVRSPSGSVVFFEAPTWCEQ